MINEEIYALAAANPDWVVAQEGECMTICNEDDINVFVYAGSKQIIAEATLFPASSVTNPAVLNDLILRTHQLVPLSTIGINSIEGEDYYIAFGSLSVDSKNSTIIEEIETLFSNVEEFIELYSEHLKQEVTA